MAAPCRNSSARPRNVKHVYKTGSRYKMLQDRSNGLVTSRTAMPASSPTPTTKCSQAAIEVFNRPLVAGVGWEFKMRSPSVNPNIVCESGRFLGDQFQSG